MSELSPLRLAAAGDIHYTRTSQGAVRRLFADVGERADVLLLAGDLTENGHPEEAKALGADLQALKIQVVAVLGNHDHECDQAEGVKETLRAAGVRVLDGEGCVIGGVGFVGTKGFAGGFGRRMLGPWGEAAIKHFVQEAIDEAMKLERAAMRLTADRRVVVLHYSPIEGTCEGEPRELYPFLGSSRLEEPINRIEASAVFHGHVHHGCPEGRTAAGVPVYNVALPVLRQANPGAPPLKYVDIPRTAVNA